MLSVLNKFNKSSILLILVYELGEVAWILICPVDKISSFLI